MQPSPLFSPDGMNLTSRNSMDLPVHAVRTEGATLRERMAIVLPHERDDDGLIHSHAWASTANPGPSCPDRQQAAQLRHHMEVVLPHERHDDGLVHGHRWAASAD